MPFPYNFWPSLQDCSWSFFSRVLDRDLVTTYTLYNCSWSFFSRVLDPPTLSWHIGNYCSWSFFSRVLDPFGRLLVSDRLLQLVFLFQSARPDWLDDYIAKWLQLVFLFQSARPLQPSEATYILLQLVFLFQSARPDVVLRHWNKVIFFIILSIKITINNLEH